MNRAAYPKDWPAISRRIRERDNQRCIFCGAENGKAHPLTGSIVVLTVAHLQDPDPMNCDESNLGALCQKCHNTLDAPMRVQHARATRTRKRTEAARASGQQQLFEEDADSAH